MKTKSTNNIYSTAFIIMLFLSVPIFSFSQNSQNLLTNSDFSSGYTAWNLTGMAVEINIENIYGGPSKTNLTAEVDAFVGLRQKMPVIPGKIYTINFKASRRTSRSTPASVGIRLMITGDASGTTYVDFTMEYSNTVFGFTNEGQTFTLPPTSKDKAVIVEFTNFNNNSTHGVILDDVFMAATGTSSLPVQLISFTGELRNEQTILNWRSCCESNNRYFIVERSANGNHYYSIGRLRPV